SLRRPAGGFAKVDEFRFRGTPFRLVAKQWRLLSAANDKPSVPLCRVAKIIELGSAELTELGNFALATSPSDGGRIETHRVFARANQDCLRRLRHAAILPPERGNDRERTRVDPSARLSYSRKTGKGSRRSD